MNGTARANARNESVGNPGRSVDGSRPAELTSISATGKTSGGIAIAGWRSVRRDRAARDGADLDRGEAHRRRAAGRAAHAHASARPRPPPRACGRSSRGTRRRASAPGARCRRARRLPHRARGRRRRDRRPASRRTARSPSAERLAVAVEELRDPRLVLRPSRRSHGRSARPISALSAVGVPSATIRPWSMIPTRSARTSASSRYCVVRNTVTPSSRARRATSSQSAVRLCGSRPVVGSSRKRTRGRWTSASARSSRRFIPPE